jgi:aryl-alcohol dehydrogenase-like predicted oxidoreductase
MLLNFLSRLFSPLSRNLLSTKAEPPNDWRSTLPRYSAENLQNNQLILDEVQGIAKKYDCTAAQLSLAWLFHKGTEMGVCVIPIPGTTKVANATTNTGSIDVIISDEDAAILETLADKVAGDRYQENRMSLTIETQYKKLNDS